jgi:hypothetical protein
MGDGNVSGVWNGDGYFSKISLGILESVDGDNIELGGKMSCSVLESVVSL